jgi:hypothetical protein
MYSYEIDFRIGESHQVTHQKIKRMKVMYNQR